MNTRVIHEGQVCNSCLAVQIADSGTVRDALNFANYKSGNPFNVMPCNMVIENALSNNGGCSTCIALFRD